MLLRRYSADLSMLKYVVHQLYNGQITDIIVFKELIGRWLALNLSPVCLLRRFLQWLEVLLYASKLLLL